ncbi:glucokinase [Echinococcus multilocularis]|uniref:Glucokinase n=1 Tax=Echinococcus multilocularis TaxID=6211 RepID=A0A0S4MS00_ECHMU|nr:glucokinase [Echinococcus multilocularis]
MWQNAFLVVRGRRLFRTKTVPNAVLISANPLNGRHLGLIRPCFIVRGYWNSNMTLHCGGSGIVAKDGIDNKTWLLDAKVVSVGEWKLTSVIGSALSDAQNYLYTCKFD